MTDSNTRFTGSIPEIFDRHLGPVIFEPFAQDLARRVVVGDGASVLETACGTGIVTRRVREAMPRGAKLVATDLNQAMIDHARAHLADLPGITWQAADAADLPFDGASFDVAVMQFGLMFVPDKDRAAREARRVLKPGGTFLVSVWDEMRLNPFSRIAHETITGLFPDDPPQFYKVPFGYTDPGVLRALLDGNGFKDVVVESVKLEARAPSARFFATGLVEGNPVRISIEERGAQLAPVVDAIASALVSEFGDTPCVSRLQAWVATARA
jgi:SAM-dependent methyltransferase